MERIGNNIRGARGGAAREAENVTKDSKNTTKGVGDIPRAFKKEKTKGDYTKEDKERNKLLQESIERNAWESMAMVLEGMKREEAENNKGGGG
jgi:hypothetical protein